jgi:hypothetical protein
VLEGFDGSLVSIDDESASFPAHPVCFDDEPEAISVL